MTEPAAIPASDGRMERLRRQLAERVDVSSIAAFRVLFFGLMTASTLRFIAEGWVERCYVTPSTYFHYWGFSWIRVLSPDAMMALHVLMGIASFAAALGLFYRLAAPLFLVTFAYIELCDVTNYLNHYYQVALLALLFCVVPAHRAFSIDAWRRPALRDRTAPRWALLLLRFQVGVVYVFAGLAKAQPDWLLHGQPLGIWLAARTGTPVLGPIFALPGIAILMSWAGFLFDTTIVFWLSWRRSRPYAYAVVIVFHVLTHVLFQIGVFPFLMILSAPIFFEPDWARRAAATLRRSVPRALPTVPDPARRPGVSKVGVALLLGYACVQLALPLRTHLYGGNVLWHEQGMRFSWRVMLRSKTGAVTFRVRSADLPNEQFVEPCRYLNTLQEREMSGRPDLILQLAHRIARDYRARGYEDVQVRADAFVSLNGRPAARLIDPEVDLARVEDGLGRASYILPAPTAPPLDMPTGRLAFRSL